MVNQLYALSLASWVAIVSTSEQSVVGVMVFSPKYKSNSAFATFSFSIVYDTLSGNVVSAEIEICRNNELVNCYQQCAC